MKLLPSSLNQFRLLAKLQAQASLASKMVASYCIGVKLNFEG
jgi:hypothetical protein